MATLATPLVRRRIDRLPEDLQPACVWILRKFVGATHACIGQLLALTCRYANGEVHHFLRDQGFLIKVPSSRREIHARGRKLRSSGVPREVSGRATRGEWKKVGGDR